MTKDFNESKVKRGQPGNAGKFAPKGDTKAVTPDVKIDQDSNETPPTLPGNPPPPKPPNRTPVGSADNEPDEGWTPSTKCQRGGLTDASMHYGEGLGYLKDAKHAFSESSWNRSVGHASTAAIHASDSICLMRLGLFSTSHNHKHAPPILERAIPENPELVADFVDLLDLKNPGQYASRMLFEKDARFCIDAAELLLQHAATLLPK